MREIPTRICRLPSALIVILISLLSVQTLNVIEWWKYLSHCKCRESVFSVWINRLHLLPLTIFGWPACYQSKSSGNDTKRLIKPEFLTHSCAMQCRNFLNQFFLVSCFWFRRRHVCYHVVCDSSCCAPKSISRVRQLSYNGPTIFTGVITLHWRHSHVTIGTTKHVDSSTKDRGPSAITFSMHIWKKKE